MTLKIHDGVFTHIDIAEGGKESRDLTSFLSLGKTLTIGEESYEDLDEVSDSNSSFLLFRSCLSKSIRVLWLDIVHILKCLSLLYS